jgi:RNA polymerase sigma factor (sigma-70 family)
MGQAIITLELLHACRRDDRRAIQALYSHCFKTLMPVCFRYHKNEEDARAALNLGFMKILSGLDNISGEINFSAWSKRIIVNSLIDEYRRNKKRNAFIFSRENDHELEFSDSSSANDGDRELAYNDLISLLKDLPTMSGKVFNLYVIDGFNHKEIADLLGMSEGTSKWHLSTARRLLREKLSSLDEKIRVAI